MCLAGLGPRPRLLISISPPLTVRPTETKGEQEIEAGLLARATFFADDVAQSISIGTAQHAIPEGLTKVKESNLAQLGALINGTNPGCMSDDEITLFDGTGTGLQDRAVAAAVVDLAVERGFAVYVDV